MVRHSNCATFCMFRSLRTRLLEVIFLHYFQAPAAEDAYCGAPKQFQITFVRPK